MSIVLWLFIMFAFSYVMYRWGHRMFMWVDRKIESVKRVKKPTIPKFPAKKEKTIDEILDKINKRGIKSLTQEEINILNKKRYKQKHFIK